MVDTEWRRKNQTFLECNRHMLETEHAADVTFTLGQSRDELVSIAAHRYVLICRSPVFDAMLRWEKTMRNSINIPDVDAEAFREMLKFIYYEEVNIKSDNVMAILYAAEKYMILALVDLCNDFLAVNLDVDTVFPILDRSIMYDRAELTEKCMNIFKNRTHTVLESEDFLYVSSSTLKVMLSCERMSLETESLVYAACLKWAETRCVERSLEITDANKREILDDVICLIRFPAMSVTEFATSGGDSSILTDSEKCEIYQTIAQRPHKELPQNQPTKSKFSSKPRNLSPCSTIVHCEDDEVVCQRFTGVDEMWNYDSHSIDALSFHADTDLMLVSIGIYGCDTESHHSVRVELINGQDDILMAVNVCQMYSNGDPSPIRIHFPTPCLIAANVVYTVQVMLRGPPTYCGDGGRDTVSCQDAVVTFQNSSRSSNSTSLTGGQIPQLIFKSKPGMEERNEKS